MNGSEGEGRHFTLAFRSLENLVLPSRNATEDISICRCHLYLPTIHCRISFLFLSNPFCPSLPASYLQVPVGAHGLLACIAGHTKWLVAFYNSHKGPYNTSVPAAQGLNRIGPLIKHEHPPPPRAHAAPPLPLDKSQWLKDKDMPLGKKILSLLQTEFDTTSQLKSFQKSSRNSTWALMMIPTPATREIQSPLSLD